MRGHELEAMQQRLQEQLERSATAVVADIRMDRIGEIEGRGARGQIEHVAGRRYSVDPVFEDFGAQTVDEVVIGLGLLDGSSS